MKAAEQTKKGDDARPLEAMGGGRLLSLVEGEGGEAHGDSLGHLDAAVRGDLTGTPDDLRLLLAHARQSFLADQRTPKAVRARDSARRLIELAPDMAEGYRLLGLAHLSRGEYREAFVALTAGKAVHSGDGFEHVRTLARKLMTNLTPAGFNVAGERYTFDLTAHNAAALEASAFHSVGTLSEWDTLAYLGTRLTAPRRIVEIGPLIGDHTAFFLKRFMPAQMILIEADPANVRFVRRTAAMNLPVAPVPEILIHHAYVAAEPRARVPFAGGVVAQQPLAALVPGPVDFLKIEVAGDPLDVLAGARPVIERARPAVMIRTRPLTHERVSQWFADQGYRIDRVIAQGNRRDLIVMPE